MNKKLPLGLRLAKLAAEKSNYKIKVGACLLPQGKIAWNKKITSPRTLWNGYPYANNSHAEYNLFPHSHQLLFPIRGTVYIYRQGAKDRLLLARPCKYCMAFLQKIGIRDIVYSIDDSWVKEKI